MKDLKPFLNENVGSEKRCLCFVHDGEDEFRLCLTHTTH